MVAYMSIACSFCKDVPGWGVHGGAEVEKDDRSLRLVDEEKVHAPQGPSVASDHILVAWQEADNL